jgi:hypothetical protein
MAARAAESEGRRKPTLSAFLSGPGLVQHAPELLLLLLGQGWCTRSLRLQQRPQEYSIILPGTHTAHISRIRLVTQMLGLEYLRLTIPAALA